jgi:predicted GNAT family acetyltransferase
VDIKYYKDATDFLARTGKYLAKDEALYGRILGMANAVLRHPELIHKEDLWLCSINSGKEILAVALSAIQHTVILGHFNGGKTDIAEKLVTAAAENFINISGVLGDKALADIFAKKWCKNQNVRIKHKMAQRLYRLDKVNDVPLSPGKFRLATMADKELVLKWYHAFYMDVSGEDPAGWEARTLPAIDQRWVFFWEDSKPVSMATKTSPTDKKMSVGGVYTPPEFRGKGYATSCVAELSRNILQSGKEFCTLYTDLSNPTSNSIYKKIGYKEVSDSVEYTFEN